MVLSFYCEQRVVQLYFEQMIFYGRLQKESVSKKTFRTTVLLNKACGTVSFWISFWNEDISAKIHLSPPVSFSSEVDLAPSLQRLPSIGAS